MKSKASYCAPSVSKNQCTCFSKKELLKIASVWNENRPDSEHIHYSKNLTKCEIWERIDTIMKKYAKCNNEQCWFKLKELAEFSRTRKELDYFRPLVPDEWFLNTKILGSDYTASENLWLSNKTISEVMNQYESDKKDFIFLGTVPIDFASKQGFGKCIALDWGPALKTTHLCDLNLDTLHKNGKTHFGVVFNTANHESSGEHWIALYCSLKKNKIIYFDSTGQPPPPEVQKYIEKINNSKQGDAKPFKIIVNTKKHQTGYSECGMYAIHFLVNMLYGKSWTQFNKGIIPDAEMLHKRLYYFNSYKKNIKDD